MRNPLSRFVKGRAVGLILGLSSLALVMGVPARAQSTGNPGAVGTAQFAAQNLQVEVSAEESPGVFVYATSWQFRLEAGAPMVTQNFHGEREFGSWNFEIDRVAVRHPAFYQTQAGDGGERWVVYVRGQRLDHRGFADGPAYVGSVVLKKGEAKSISFSSYSRTDMSFNNLRLRLSY